MLGAAPTVPSLAHSDEACDFCASVNQEGNGKSASRSTNLRLLSLLYSLKKFFPQFGPPSISVHHQLSRNLSNSPKVVERGNPPRTDGFIPGLLRMTTRAAKCFSASVFARRNDSMFVQRG